MPRLKLKNLFVCCTKKTVKEGKETDLSTFANKEIIYECVNSEKSINSSIVDSEVWGDPDKRIEDKYNIEMLEVEEYQSRDKSVYKGDMAKTKIRGEDVQVKQGEGTLKSSNGDVYVGVFRNGRKHGHGEMTYGNGDVFKVKWKRDKAHGEGVF